MRCCTWSRQGVSGAICRMTAGFYRAQLLSPSAAKRTLELNFGTLEKICAAVIAAPLSTRLTNISLERTFAWLNPSRRLSKDYELTATSAETMIKISHIHTLLKRL